MHFSKSSRGFTLIEVLVAIVILMVGLLALLNSASVLMQRNLQNVLRDEAVRIAEQDMTRLRNTPVASLPLGITAPPAEQRNMRAFTQQYTITRTIAAPSAETRNLQVVVSWTYRNQTYQHGIATMVAMPL